jgi:uncharacterized PurR-regulated membrane protein YhhQ (DUF165 family)
MAKNLIWLSLLLQFIYAILITIDIHLPISPYWEDADSYSIVFGSVIRFVTAGTLANLSSNFINIYLVSKLKIPFEGKLFWLRSIISTIFGGFIMVSLIIVIGFTGDKINIHQSWIMFKSTFSLEILYAFLLVIPAASLAGFLKKTENIDVYDYDTNFNPFLLPIREKL